MPSRYEIFCHVIEAANFTRAAEQLAYSQSAISQAIKSLENEVGHTLIERRKDGVILSRDGQAFFPYIQEICAAEVALRKKTMEMHGLENSTIRISAFTSISQSLLPPLMRAFKEKYPEVCFEIHQGDYTAIEQQIRSGQVDFGFVVQETGVTLDCRTISHDELMAVLPARHPLASQEQVSLEQLSRESFILLDEGEYSAAMGSFARKGLEPRVEYKLHDDYSILLMVKQGMGVSMLYQLLLDRHPDVGRDIVVRPLTESVQRTVALAWNNWNTLPKASRKFAEFIMEKV